MGRGRGLRGLLVERPGSLGDRSRTRRWETFQRLFPDVAGLRVVDLGGTPATWLRAPVRPKHVVVVNLAELDDPGEPWLTVEHGDACALPERLFEQPFDIVFSNSLIEHVGGHARRQDLADAVHRLAPRHWVQTPYRYFPVEPHWLFPGMQFLPLRARAFIARVWPLAHTRASREAATRVALGTELVSLTELRYYFPGSEIVRERFGPLVKSIVAVRTEPGAT
jgi:hypothetical protein